MASHTQSCSFCHTHPSPVTRSWCPGPRLWGGGCWCQLHTAPCPPPRHTGHQAHWSWTQSTLALTRHLLPLSQPQPDTAWFLGPPLWSETNKHSKAKRDLICEYSIQPDQTYMHYALKAYCLFKKQSHSREYEGFTFVLSIGCFRENIQWHPTSSSSWWLCHWCETTLYFRTCEHYHVWKTDLVVIGIRHIEEALVRSPGHTKRVLELCVHSFPVHVPKRKQVLSPKNTTWKTWVTLHVSTHFNATSHPSI